MILSVIRWVIIFILLLITLTNNIEQRGQIDAYQKRYEILTYQLKNNMYDNDNEIGKRNIYSKIERWNCDLAYRKKMQNNIFVGMFYPNIYDNFEFIELPQGE